MSQGIEQNHPVFLISDLHGHLTHLNDLLQTAGLINTQMKWTGGKASLWFLGDYFDNGPPGIPLIDAIIKLQHQAEQSGGQVGALLGNHDICILAAKKFPNVINQTTGNTFYVDWLANGGNPVDFHSLEESHIHWLSSLPAGSRINDTLLLHADSLFYLEYGHNLETLNLNFKYLLKQERWEYISKLLLDFSQHRDFLGSDGKENLQTLLSTYGGQLLVHGHTPISKITGQLPQSIHEAYVYLEGRCINLDGGMYLGGPGFLYQLR